MALVNTNNHLVSGIAKIVLVVSVVSLGLWGCSRKPADKNASADRIRALENRCVKLETASEQFKKERDKALIDVADLRRENTRLLKEIEDNGNKQGEEGRRLTHAESRIAELVQTLEQRNLERDRLQRQVIAKTRDLETLQTRLTRLRTSLQTLVGQEEVPVRSMPTPEPISAPAGGPTLGNSE